MEWPSLEKGDSKFAIKIVRLTLVRQFITDSVEVGRPRNLFCENLNDLEKNVFNQFRTRRKQ
jgi:hypothetical protein